MEETLKKVLKVATEQIGLAWGFEEDLSKLQKWLLKAEAFLGDINTRKLHHRSVRIWVDHLQHLVYQADDLLDEIVYELLRKKVQTSKMKKVRNFVSPSSNAFLFRLNMAKKMKILIELLEKHYNEAAPLGLVGNESVGPEIDVISQFRETISELDDYEIVGRDDEVKSIVAQVIDASNQQLECILPIVGMGGLGKTTLAKLVFNHEMVRQNFDKTVWVCVSEPFIVNKILGEILQNLIPNSHGGDNNREVLLRELQKKMHGQRYFLVLDDVWNENAFLWDELKYCLLRITGNSGNCIVVTTRNADIAKLMETHPSHHLSKLSDDQYWSLFKESAKAYGLIPMTSNLDMVQKELTKKVGGVPLVARVLGRAVRFEGDDERWVNALESVLRTPLQEENFVLSILKLSVDRLPSSSLKQCFAYCSNFPKDFVFDKQKLVQMWMAQGFLQPQEGRNNTTMENVGDVYFSILLSRCLFQDVLKDDQGRIRSCKMHDLIHDIACTISIDQELKLNPSHMLAKELGKKVRSKKVASKLRTIDFFKKIPCNIDQKVFDVNIKNFVSLRVLRMSISLDDKLPESIGQLKHLRYLEISNSFVLRFPRSIVLFYNLQTLKIKNSVIHDLPKNLTDLINLRHVEFPWKVEKMPPHLSQLTQLQTLSGFVVGFEKGCKITELGHLKNLEGSLKLFCLEKVESKEEASRAHLVDKENLNELELGLVCGKKR
ncbi:unnamed protein product [Citrullus colocynthis]|uniref:Disease resistance protein RGA3 n=1 Tax=Citrullus colocynthis TaxID=252529 RepID=A0ABP0Y7G6_9ROSI